MISSNRACQTIDFFDLVRCATKAGAGFIQQPIHCGLRLRCGGQKRALVVFQQLHPMADIGCVIAEVIRRQIEMSAKDRCANLGDKLFCRESMRAKALGHIAPNAMRGAGRMDRLVVQRRCIVIR